MRVFGKWIFSTVLILSFNASAKISVISDLDDTIKITNVANRARMIRNSLFSNKVFSGAAEFYSSFDEGDLFVLTASPSILRFKINKTLKINEVFFESLITRVYLWHWDKFQYKVNSIKRILQKNPTGDFILIGDDVGKDPQAYWHIMNLYPERIKAIYIRNVKGNALPSDSIISFSHYLEILGNEVVEGRVDPKHVKTLVDAYNLESTFYNIIPTFAYCPLWEEMDHSALLYVNAMDYTSFVARVNKACKKRRGLYSAIIH